MAGIGVLHHISRQDAHSIDCNGNVSLQRFGLLVILFLILAHYRYSIVDIQKTSEGLTCVHENYKQLHNTTMKGLH